MGEAQGKKVEPPPLRQRRSRRSRPLARSSHQRPRGVGPAAPRRKTWRMLSEPHKRSGLPGEEKETLACRWARPQHAWKRVAQPSSADFGVCVETPPRSERWMYPAVIMRWIREDRPDKPLKATNGAFSPFWSATLTDQAMSGRQQSPARRRAGERAPSVPTPSLPR
jgi:hypothetical protein